MTRILFICLLISTPLLAAETGYRIEHPDGSVEFTDRPDKTGEAISIPQVSTFPSVHSESSRSLPTAVSQDPDTKKDQQVENVTLTISSPREQETVWFDANGVVVTLQVVPALPEGSKIVLHLDGKEVASGYATSITLKDVYRGSHVLSAAVIDGQGKVISESAPVTFFMRQHSALHPFQQP